MIKRYLLRVDRLPQGHYALAAHELTEQQKEEWELCADYYAAYYRYSESLIKDLEVAELSEDSELIEKLEDFLPAKS